MAGFAGHHRGVDGADACGPVAGRGPGGGPAVDFRWGGLSARVGRATGHRRPRGVEHLRTDRSHRGVLRRTTRRRRTGQHRVAFGWLGSRCRRRCRRPGGTRRGRRTGDRRTGPGALPRPGEGCRKVRADAVAGLEPRLPQRRPGAVGGRRALLPGPGRRSGEGRRAPHRTRRGRLRSRAPARSQWRCCRRAQDCRWHTGFGRIHRLGRPRLRPKCSARAPHRIVASGHGPPAGAARRTAYPDIGKGRPGCTAVARPRSRGS